MRKIIGIILIFIICGLFIYIIKPQDTKKVEIKETIEKEEKNPQEPLNEVKEDIVKNIETYTTDSYVARLTSYYPEEGETMTATGLGINDFQTNEKGWFTYNGKLVVATASERLGHTNMRTYNLYDEIVLNIDGIDYNAIVLDVCGACMWDNRIDLFVSSVRYVKDTQMEVKR